MDYKKLHGKKYKANIDKFLSLKNNWYDPMLYSFFFDAEYRGMKNFEGKISYFNPYVCLCQNFCDGKTIEEKFGYKFTWAIVPKDMDYLLDNKVIVIMDREEKLRRILNVS